MCRRDRLAAAQLETVGVSLDELKEKGIVELSDPGFEYKTPKFKTPTEKFQFSSCLLYTSRCV